MLTIEDNKPIVLDEGICTESSQAFERYDLATAPTIAKSEERRIAHEMQARIIDRMVPAKDLKVVESANFMIEPDVFLLYEGQKYKFTNRAFAQLCEKSGMGVTSYMKKCLGKSLGWLVPENINAWLASGAEKQLLVRFLDGYVIAFLSDKYGVFDHGDAIDCISEALGQVDGSERYAFEAGYVGVDNMSIRMVDTDKILLSDGSNGRDTSTAGIIFRNGQTGASAFSIEYLIYTFACTNGLIIASDRGMVFRRKHAGNVAEQFAAQVASAVALFPSYVEQARKDIEAARQIKIMTGRGENKLITQLTLGLSISPGAAEDIVALMHERWDTNMWGFAGAITEAAQSYSAERQYQFEKYAGELLHSAVA